MVLGRFSSFFLWFQVGFSWFQVGFHGFSWFQVGFTWLFMVFHGSRSVFMVSMDQGRIFIFPGRFSLFFMFPG